MLARIDAELSYTLAVQAFTRIRCLEDGVVALRGGLRRDDVENDRVGPDGVGLGEYGALLFVL